MAGNATWRCVFSPELFHSVRLRRSSFSLTPPLFKNGGLYQAHRSNVFLIRPPNLDFTRLTSLSSSENGTPPTTSSSDQKENEPAQEAVLKAISEVSKAEGRVGKTSNVVIGDVGTDKDNATSDWLALDQKVNSYPMVRGFTAIGTGGYDFVQAMVVAVESVILQPISEDSVKHRLSSRGKYVSVNIGPVQVMSSHQRFTDERFIPVVIRSYSKLEVQAVYTAMRRDERVKYFL